MPTYCEKHQRYHVPINRQASLGNTHCPDCYKENVTITTTPDTPRSPEELKFTPEAAVRCAANYFEIYLDESPEVLAHTRALRDLQSKLFRLTDPALREAIHVAGEAIQRVEYAARSIASLDLRFAPAQISYASLKRMYDALTAICSAPTPAASPPHTGAVVTLPQWLIVYIRQISELPDGGRTKDQRAILHLVTALDSTLPEPQKGLDVFTRDEVSVACMDAFASGRVYTRMGEKDEPGVAHEKAVEHAMRAITMDRHGRAGKYSSTPLERNA